MNDGWAVLLAAATAAGALTPGSVPVSLGVALGLVALAARRPALLCVGAALAASALAAASWAGLRQPPSGPVTGEATLVGDPVDVDGAVRVELRLGGRRVEAWARGQAAGRLRERLAGQRVTLSGRLEPVTGRRRGYLAHRHVAARVIVEGVDGWSPGGFTARLSNGLRGVLMDGAASLPDRARALFAGFVLGDDRDQDPGTVEDFRASGLSHLLAVSGQNVAFVLALAAPLTSRLGLRSRFVAVLGVLLVFGVVTRWEPSVLRAEAMAAVSVLAATAGRPASTVRVLALAVTALLLVDPLLVGSVGFLLSCGACAGIATLTGPLSRRLPLPLAVTLAAQVGVAPVLLPVFGSLPVASVPANLLAVPAAGPVMVWGLAAGLPAGLVGGPLAVAVHGPTRLLVGWIDGVAGWAARLPLGQLRTGHAVVLAGLALVAALVRRLRPVAVALTVAVCLSASAIPPGNVSGAELTQGARLWRTGAASVLVVQRPRPGPLLAALRGAGVQGIGILVVAGRDPGAELPPGLVLVTDRHRPALVLTAGRVALGAQVRLGRLRVDVRAVSPGLVVRVRGG